MGSAEGGQVLVGHVDIGVAGDAVGDSLLGLLCVAILVLVGILRYLRCLAASERLLLVSGVRVLDDALDALEAGPRWAAVEVAEAKAGAALLALLLHEHLRMTGVLEGGDRVHSAFLLGEGTAPVVEGAL